MFGVRILLILPITMLTDHLGILLTKDSELGDNETIRSASGFCAPYETDSRRARKKEKVIQKYVLSPQYLLKFVFLKYILIPVRQILKLTL